MSDCSDGGGDGCGAYLPLVAVSMLFITIIMDYDERKFPFAVVLFAYMNRMIVYEPFSVRSKNFREIVMQRREDKNI